MTLRRVLSLLCVLAALLGFAPPLSAAEPAGNPAAAPAPKNAEASTPLGAFLSAIGGGGTTSATAANAALPVPLTLNQRTIHVFRAPLGMFGPAERAEGAKRRIEDAIEQTGEGWTSVRPVDLGIQIELDGKPMFLVMPGDANPLAGETAEDLATRATRVLQKIWAEARERRDHRASVEAIGRVAVATVLLIVGVLALVALQGRLDALAARRIARQLERLGSHGPSMTGDWGRRLSRLSSKVLLLCFWLAGLLLAYAWLTFSLGQFVLTRPASERLSATLTAMSGEALLAIAAALPGMFIAVLIFLAAWVATRIATVFFESVAVRPIGHGWLNTHTAPTTRRIVNATLWLFAVAMAYPYLPGAHSEAFKGLSVMLGLMASIGAAGIVGQIAAGVMIVYTYALTKGEYVRIQEHEGTVTDIGLFETRLRTGLGEEISLPNALVLGNVLRNYSRVQGDVGVGGAGGAGCSMIAISLSIGYDTPWRQVHAMLHEAGATVAEVRSDPPAQIVQSALSDFYVEYRFIVHVDTRVPTTRARITSNLHAAILDTFNRYGVQIMSPHYQRDPAAPKVVPESDWALPPAKR